MEEVSRSTSTRGKDATGKAPRERGDGEYSRGPGENKEMGEEGK